MSAPARTRPEPYGAEMVDDNISRSLIARATEVAPALAGGLVGLALTGDPEVAVGGTVVAQYLAGVGQDVLVSRRRRMGAVITHVLTRLGRERVDEAVQDPVRLELLARVLEAAATSTVEEKVDALGQVLAGGLQVDGDAAEALLLVAGLAVIDQAHVRVLDAVREPRVGEPDDGAGWLPVEVGASAELPVSLTTAALQVLAGQGLVDGNRTTRALPPVDGVEGNPIVQAWVITEHGLRMLRLLQPGST